MAVEHPRGSYREVIAWQRGIELCLAVYSVTREFPDREQYGLTAELRKTARSIVYNIAEGHRRRSSADFSRFLDIARGSQAEVDTQLVLAKELGYVEGPAFDRLVTLSDDVGALIYTLSRAVRRMG